ncbi:MAG: hypothetical protein ACTSQI_13725 [Candidatus Helarchaeota archaeon]
MIFRLRSMKIWIIVYVILTFFDVIVTYFVMSGGVFGIADEGNAAIRALMEKYGIWQGLTIYVIQEFAIFFLLWGGLYLIIKHLMKDRSEAILRRVDIVIFNIGAPFFIMASALLHLFGGIFWIVLSSTGALDMWFPLNFIVYMTAICGFLQTIHVSKLQAEPKPPNNQ